MEFKIFYTTNYSTKINQNNEFFKLELMRSTLDEMVNKVADNNKELLLN